MTDTMIVEAVRAAGGAAAPQTAADAAAATSAVADPSAVARFEAAMGASAVGGAAPVQAADPVPFANELAASWRSAQTNNQGILHRIRALTELRMQHSPSAPELVELQYEVANLAFQQEVVTKVADKSSNAIQTLVKNQ